MRTRSLFWPFVLIATGIIWLLINLGSLPGANLWALYNCLPYLLLALGVGLILRARWPLAGPISSAVIVGGALLAVIFAAPLGWNTSPAWGCIVGDSPLQGCAWTFGGNGETKGSGVLATETRSVPEFSALSVDFPAMITVQQGDTQSVTVEAEDNLLPQLETRVTNDVLHIDVKGINWDQHINPTQPVRIKITVKDLNKIDFSTAGSVDVEGLQTESLEISASGAGRVSLSGLRVHDLNIDVSGALTVEADGAADNLDVDISGMGNFQGEELAAQNANVNISGAGSANLWVEQELTADISGAGSINYYGAPKVRQNVSGLGSVHRLGDK